MLSRRSLHLFTKCSLISEECITLCGNRTEYFKLSRRDVAPEFLILQIKLLGQLINIIKVEPVSREQQGAMKLYVDHLVNSNKLIENL